MYCGQCQQENPAKSEAQKVPVLGFLTSQLI